MGTSVDRLTERTTRSMVVVTGGSYTADPYAGRTGWLVDVSVVRGLEDLFEVQLANTLECIWLAREEFEFSKS